MTNAGDRELYGELSRLNNDLVNMQRETFKMSAALELQQQELLKTNAALEDANRRLESLAMQDGLTGLSNHRAFQERLEVEVRRAVRYRIPLALVMLDVDHFKQYNDTYGHPAGDVVLKHIAALLQSAVRVTDLAARYGGEEFALILTQTDLDGALILAERVRAVIEAAPWEKRAVTVSLGVSDLSPDAADPAALISCADKALYRSKKNGKNRVTQGCLADGQTPVVPAVLENSPDRLMRGRENQLLDELSRLNNELINAKRELTKKNMALKDARALLEVRVQERTVELQRAMEEAERANAAKSDFLSRMSHELRTPMNSILGFAQIMEMDDPSDTQSQRIAHIMTAGERLLLLIDEILGVTLAESKCRPPPPKADLPEERQSRDETESLG